MAAISALMISDNALRQDVAEDDRGPATPRAIISSTLSSQHDAADTRIAQSFHPSTDSSQISTQATAPPSTESTQGTDNTQPLFHETAKSDEMDVTTADDDLDGSDQDTEQGDSGGSSRKKKGQRFFCTGYPPCNLSFTRSEHLARHIRKHTGERPFQCHCNRRFSRLDNLRQHAQTVHVNEEIPNDSLAATGTRYQRQIRTDRVRPAGRPRAGTMSSTGSHSRGHSRNLSTSSIGSTSSNFSISTEARRRPPPLLMAGDSMNRPTTPPSQFPAFAGSPADMSTPTSSTYPATPTSPGLGSTIGSPLSAMSRTGDGYAGSRTPGRRLSVPSSAHQHPGQFGSPYSSSYGGPSPSGSGGGGFSTNSSIITSPTSSTFSYGPGYHVPPGEDWRRRTWHPSTYSGLNFNYGRPATSGLTYSQTPDAPQPAFAQNAIAAAGQAPRLPGIESFDHVQHRPTTPPRRNPSPMNLDVERQQPLMPAPEIDGPRRGHASWDGLRSSHPSGMNDAANRGTTSWGQETLEQLQSISRPAGVHEQHNMGPPPVTNTMSLPPPPPPFHAPTHDAHHFQPANRNFKRNGWLNGPGPATRTSPEDSSSSEGIPTPGTSTIEIHPAIIHSNGYIESQHPTVPADGHHNPCLPQPLSGPRAFANQQPRPRTSSMSTSINNEHNMDRLEALVAVATSEKNVPSAAR